MRKNAHTLNVSAYALQALFLLCRRLLPVRRLLRKSRSPGLPLLLLPSLQEGRLRMGSLRVHLVLRPVRLPLLLLDLGPAREVEVSLVARLLRASAPLSLQLLRELQRGRLLVRSGRPLPALLPRLPLPAYSSTLCNAMSRESLRRYAPVLVPSVFPDLRIEEQGRIAEPALGRTGLLSRVCEVAPWLDWWLSTCGGFREHMPAEVRADFERLILSGSRALEFLASQGCTALGNLVLSRRDSLLADVRSTVPAEEVARLRYSPLPETVSIFPSPLLDSALTKMRAAANDALVQRILHPPRIPRKPAAAGGSAGSSSTGSTQASSAGAHPAQKQSSTSSPSGQSGKKRKSRKGKAVFSSFSGGSGRSGGKGKGAGKKST